MGDVEFHFALENIFGIGMNFLKECIKEAKIFKEAEIINSSDITWSELYNIKIGKEKKY